MSSRHPPTPKRMSRFRVHPHHHDEKWIDDDEEEKDAMSLAAEWLTSLSSHPKNGAYVNEPMARKKFIEALPGKDAPPEDVLDHAYAFTRYFGVHVLEKGYADYRHVEMIERLFDMVADPNVRASLCDAVDAVCICAIRCSINDFGMMTGSAADNIHKLRAFTGVHDKTLSEYDKLYARASHLLARSLTLRSEAMGKGDEIVVKVGEDGTKVKRTVDWKSIRAECVEKVYELDFGTTLKWNAGPLNSFFWGAFRLELALYYTASGIGPFLTAFDTKNGGQTDTMFVAAYRYLAYFSSETFEAFDDVCKILLQLNTLSEFHVELFVKIYLSPSSLGTTPLRHRTERVRAAVALWPHSKGDISLTQEEHNELLKWISLNEDGAVAACCCCGSGTAEFRSLLRRVSVLDDEMVMERS